MWQGIKDIFSSVGNFFSSVFTSAVNGIKNAWSGIKNFFSGVWDGIKNIFSSVGSWFGNVFNTAVNGVKNAWSSITGFFGNIWTEIKNAFGDVAGWFKNVFADAWQGVKNVFSTGGKIFDGIKDGIASVFKTVVNGLIGGINKVIAFPFNKINGMLNSIRDISILGIEPFKGLWEKNPLSVPQIPKLAKGAVIPGGNPFMAILGDQPRGMTNIEAPLDTIRQAVKMELKEAFKGRKLNYQVANLVPELPYDRYDTSTEKYTNPTTVDNGQITEGIANAVYRAFVEANINIGTNNQQPIIKVYIGNKELEDITIEGINNRIISSGKNPLYI